MRFSKPGDAYAGLVKSHRDGPRWTGDVRFVAEKLAEPLRWKAPRDGSRHRIFVNSMSDLFHEGFTNEQVAAGFGVMAACPQHDFLILTKRAERMREWFEWAAALPERDSGKAPIAGYLGEYAIRETDGKCNVWLHGTLPVWPLPNVWLGVSAEDQQRADERIPLLLQCPAAVRWVSAEPLLGPIDLHGMPDAGLRSRTTGDWKQGAALSWVVVGGESGPGARPCNVEWIRSIVHQCREAGVACFTKQLGAGPMLTPGTGDDTHARVQSERDQERAWPDGTTFGNRTGDPKYNGLQVLLRDCKGGDPNEWSADLRVREYPA
jgi:protein gp37